MYPAEMAQVMFYIYILFSHFWRLSLMHNFLPPPQGHQIKRSNQYNVCYKYQTDRILRGVQKHISTRMMCNNTVRTPNPACHHTQILQVRVCCNWFVSKVIFYLLLRNLELEVASSLHRTVSSTWRRHARVEYCASQSFPVILARILLMWTHPEK